MIPCSLTTATHLYLQKFLLWQRSSLAEVSIAGPTAFKSHYLGLFCVDVHADTNEQPPALSAHQTNVTPFCLSLGWLFDLDVSPGLLCAGT